MRNNYTPLDLKKFNVGQSKKPGTVDLVLIGIIVITLVVLAVLMFMLLQKQQML